MACGDCAIAGPAVTSPGVGFGLFLKGGLRGGGSAALRRAARVRRLRTESYLHGQPGCALACGAAPGAAVAPHACVPGRLCRWVCTDPTSACMMGPVNTSASHHRRTSSGPERTDHACPLQILQTKEVPSAYMGRCHGEVYMSATNQATHYTLTMATRAYRMRHCGPLPQVHCRLGAA